MLLNNIQNKLKWAACCLCIDNAALSPYAYDILPFIMMIFIVLSLGD